MGIPASILNSSIVGTLWIRFELFLVHSCSEPEVYKVGLVLSSSLHAHEDVGPFDVSVDVPSTVDVI